MPAWWGKKSSSSRKKEETKKGKEKTKSFDEILARKSAKNSGVFSSASGCDSDGALEKRGHPLPSPSTFPALGPDQGTGSGSASSVSSSGSSDEPPDLGFMGLYRYSDPANSPRGRSIECNSRKQIAESRQQISLSPFSDSSKHPDLSTSPGGEFPIVSTAMKFNPRSRSPGPTSRPHSLLSSPLHPRVSGFNPDSPTERQEDGKNLGHPLPLPPGSPNSSFSSHTLRSNGVHDNSQSLHSKWKKGKLLGRGTFGHVYVGFNSESGQMCAIKEVRVISDDQNSKECLRQLNQEITLLSQLSHPNIVQYYGSELAEETLSVYLEYVSGGSIHKLLQEYGSFKEPVIQSYARQILSGLAYLHGRKTVHRDIKGANILVDPSGVIKLADFGMAKHITTCTNVLSFKGSPYWMAPEVIMNSNGYNLAVDIWSLGCTILEMATSKPPWSQYEGVAAIFKIGNSKDIPEVPDHISEEGKNFLKLCLQREPSARPTAAQLLEHPFVRDHTSPKIVRVNLSRELQPSTPDGSHSPNSTEFQTNRLNNRSCDEDYGMRQRGGFPTAFNDLSEGIHTRTNMSLPVSPCSSPLRRSGPAHRSCFLSPPHLTYTMGISDYGYNTHPILPPTRTGNQVRRLSENFLDLRADIIQLKSQTPDASPRSRHMRSVCL